MSQWNALSEFLVSYGCWKLTEVLLESFHISASILNHRNRYDLFYQYAEGFLNQQPKFESMKF